MDNKPKLLKFFNSNEIIFASSNEDASYNGFNVNGYQHYELYYSDGWSASFHSLCNLCSERTCNTVCEINDIIMCTAEQVKNAKEAYYKKFKKHK